MWFPRIKQKKEFFKIYNLYGYPAIIVVRGKNEKQNIGGYVMIDSPVKEVGIFLKLTFLLLQLIRNSLSFNSYRGDGNTNYSWGT